jgi:uncharacterized protein (DUF488 family)
MELTTIGHGTLAAPAFADLVIDAGLRIVVDVRRFPGSRRHPHFAFEAMQRWLPAAGVAYAWDERLGGRRRGREGSPNLGLRNPSFRAFADHMATPAFAAALDELLTTADRSPTAMMCAESLWWRCHRRLIADAAVLLRGAEVRHLMPDGSRRRHEPTTGAAVTDGVVVYEPDQAPML